MGICQTATAEWVSTPFTGQVVSVRTYQVGVNVGLRAEIAVSGMSHTCGTGPTVFYFDSDKIPMDVVKSVMSLAFGAMVSGKKIGITYDCSLAGGGYGWAVALAVSNG